MICFHLCFFGELQLFDQKLIICLYCQVRVNALLCFGDLVHKLDKHAILEILQTIQRCTAVDRSAPTLMCTLGVANSILKQVIVPGDRCRLTTALASICW